MKVTFRIILLFKKNSSFKNLEINLEDMSLKLIKENTEEMKYNISINQDSVFIKEGNTIKYLGDFNEKSSAFRVKKFFK